MKNRLVALLLIFILSCQLVTVVSAETDEEGENEEVIRTIAYPTGDMEMTDEELSALKENIPMIVDVKPNSLYKERLNEELGITDEDTDSGLSDVVADGDEVISTADSSAVMLFASEDDILPSKVDNSQEATFPVIGDQGDLGTCVGWALGYYQLTNNANKVRGTEAKNGTSNVKSKIYSPNWIYNLGGYGDATRGMTVKSALNVLYTYGCPSVSKVALAADNSNVANYASWYTEEDIWENALYNKCDIYFGDINPDKLDTPITSPDSPYLDNIKKLLADGYVVTIRTCVSSSYPVTKKGRTSSGTLAYVWTEAKIISDGGHAVTIVGYDDNFKVDINGNGSYQTGEYGAFKIANSWGTDAEAHNKGYVWLSYDALNSKSSVKTSNVSQRMGAIRDGIFYFVKPQKEYKPLVTGIITIALSKRDEVEIEIGISDADNNDNYYEEELTEAYYNINGESKTLYGDIAFGDSEGEYNLYGGVGLSAGTVVFDFTQLLKNFELKENHNYNLYIKLSNSSESHTAKINSFKIKDNRTGTVYTSTEVPVTASGGTEKVNVAYMSGIMTAQKGKTFLLTFNSKLNEETVDKYAITVTNEDEDYSDVDVSLAGTENQIYLYSGNLTNDFYTINIGPEVKSKGGNGLGSTVTKLFYIPFH